METTTSGGTHHPASVLLVANWESGVGYAWWLMESFWAELAKRYRCRLAYPKITAIPPTIQAAPLATDEIDFTRTGIRAVVAQCRYLAQHRIQTIYFTDQPTRHWRYALFRACGVRSIIVHDHTPGVRTPPAGIKRSIKTWLHRLPYYTADAVVAVSDYIRQRAIEVSCVPAERCHVAQNGIPGYVPEYADPYEIFGIPRKIPIIVSVGRACAYKNLHVAITALAALPHRNWHYLVLGDGPDLGAFKYLAATLGVEKQITFAGNRTDVKDLLPWCYAGLHLSQGEAFSLAILEMMQAGLPLVVSDNPSVRGATDNGYDGFVCGSTEQVTFAIHALINHSEMARSMGELAQIKVAERYSLRATHRQLLAVFEAQHAGVTECA